MKAYGGMLVKMCSTVLCSSISNNNMSERPFDICENAFDISETAFRISEKAVAQDVVVAVVFLFSFWYHPDVEESLRSFPDASTSES